MSTTSNINSDKFSISLKNNKDYYNLEINIENNKLNFNCSSFYSYNKKIINQSYSFEELQNINELFSLYNNINEIYDVLIDLFNNSKKIDYNFPSIDENENENKFDIILFPNLGKIKIIKIPLISKIEKENIKINEKIFDEIEEDVKKLDSFINMFEKNKKEISDLKIKNKNLITQIESNKKIDIKYVDIEKQRKLENLSITKNNFHTEEFITKSKMEILKNWIINSSSFYKNKNFEFSLIYKATIHGDSANNFHKKVDGNGPIIIIIKTVDNKIIGGYTSKPWSSSNNIQYDSEAFLFTFESFKIYKIIKSSYACLHLTEEGPIFGNSYELFISDKCLNNQSSFVNGEGNCFNIYDKLNLLNNPKKTYFQVLDYEVHKLKFINLIDNKIIKKFINI